MMEDLFKKLGNMFNPANQGLIPDKKPETLVKENKERMFLTNQEIIDSLKEQTKTFN